MPGPARPLDGRRIVLGVTGGIAAYKAILVCRHLIDLGAHVIPVLTDAALNMVGATTFAALASEPPRTSLWDDPDPIPHTTLGQTADLIVVCPATARILADYRSGRAGDLLSATLIATEAPVVVCPAMHTEMWQHPAVVDNLDVLASRGTVIVPPEDGRLAGGDVGAGRLAEPETIVDAVVSTLSGSRSALAGFKVVVTAGGTREAIDPVRFIGNRSSGKQGHALAEEASRRGADVTLITTADRPSGAAIERVAVSTAAEMQAAVAAAAASADLVIMAAAVADFRPVEVSGGKLKKADGVPRIELEATPDIISGLAADRPAGQVLVGFAAETTDLTGNARAKLERKQVDFIVANDVSAPGVGFHHDTNAVTIFAADGSSTEVALSGKDQIARAVLDVVTVPLLRTP